MRCYLDRTSLLKGGSLGPVPSPNHLGCQGRYWVNPPQDDLHPDRMVGAGCIAPARASRWLHLRCSDNTRLSGSYTTARNCDEEGNSGGKDRPPYFTLQRGLPPLTDMAQQIQFSAFGPGRRAHQVETKLNALIIPTLPSVPATGIRKILLHAALPYTTSGTPGQSWSAPPTHESGHPRPKYLHTRQLAARRLDPGRPGPRLHCSQTDPIWDASS